MEHGGCEVGRFTIHIESRLTILVLFFHRLMAKTLTVRVRNIGSNPIEKANGFLVVFAITNVRLGITVKRVEWTAFNEKPLTSAQSSAGS